MRLSPTSARPHLKVQTSSGAAAVVNLHDEVSWLNGTILLATKPRNRKWNIMELMIIGTRSRTLKKTPVLAKLIALLKFQQLDKCNTLLMKAKIMTMTP
eukprot:6381469-Amphidinium_carterae.1